MGAAQPVETLPDEGGGVLAPGWTAWSAVAVTLVLWASAFVAIRHLGRSFAPGPLSLGRLITGSLTLGLVLLLAGARGRSAWRRPTGRQWVSMATIGILWFGIYNVALNEGERRVDAGTAALLIQLSPILIAALAAAVLRERPTRWLLIGSVVAFAGVAVIALASSEGSGGAGGSGDGTGDVLGVLLCLLSAVVYAISLVVQKPLMGSLSALQVVFVACTVGLAACLPFAGGLVTEVRAASVADVWWLVYLGVFPTAIAFTTYAFALRGMSASSLSVTTYLVPVIAVLMSWALLGETPAPVVYAGGALCLVGVALSRRTSTAPA